MRTCFARWPPSSRFSALTATAKTRFGSGWAWLVLKDGKLAIGSTANRDSPLMGQDTAGLSGTPILGLDVWDTPTT